MITIIFSKISFEQWRTSPPGVLFEFLGGDVSLGPWTLSPYQNLVQLNFANLYQTKLVLNYFFEDEILADEILCLIFDKIAKSKGNVIYNH